MATAPDATVEEMDVEREITPQTEHTVAATRYIGIHAANDFMDKERGNTKEALTQRWLLPNAAAIQLVSGRWKRVVGIRKARNENRFQVRFAASEATTPSPGPQRGRGLAVRSSQRDKDNLWYVRRTV